ncbi:phosphatase PAP2 family protein [Pleurocapsales cyanobacterium LEGE 10410]|nr:phosphatase PAP2 family protein [Pleurocapsales cyanobacterium LEGE 10410]
MNKYQRLSKINFYSFLLLLIPFTILCGQILTKNYPVVDLQIVEIIRENRSAILDFFFVNTYRITDTYVTGSLIFIILIFLVRQRYWQEVKALVFATLGILILVDRILKPLFDRPRPPKPRLVADLSPDSFPSGHAAGNLVLYFYLSFIFAARYPKLTKYIYGLATIIVFLVGFGSMYVNAHWATDILAGYVFGYCWLLISLALLKFLSYKQN